MELTSNKQVLDFVNQAKTLACPDQVVWIDGSEEQLEQIVADHTEGKLLGIFGEETVNVLGVNLDIAKVMGLVGDEFK